MYKKYDSKKSYQFFHLNIGICIYDDYSHISTYFSNFYPTNVGVEPQIHNSSLVTILKETLQGNMFSDTSRICNTPHPLSSYD